jgi:quaternary ammonium compound-resistance protein SugE
MPSANFSAMAHTISRRPAPIKMVQANSCPPTKFTRFWPSAIGLVAAVTSFVMLSVALKSLPVGTAYAVWVGIGTFGVAIVGMLALGESASVLRLIFLVLILAGIVGLKMVEA